MGHAPNQARKVAEAAHRQEADDRRRNGFTVFRFDFNPKLTRYDLTLGEAVRYLMRLTGTRISFWRCPVRGLAIQYKKLPTTRMHHDKGETWMMLHFTDLQDEVAAKKALVLDMLLRGIDLYRGLPNSHYDQEVALIRQILTCRAAVSAEDWLAMKARLDPRTQPLIDTHNADLRCHLLGEVYKGPTGPVAIGVRTYG